MSGKFNCTLQRAWVPPEPTTEEEQEEEAAPILKSSTIYDHYPLVATERQRAPKNRMPPTRDCDPNPPTTGMALDRNQWFETQWTDFRANQTPLPASHPSDFRSAFVASRTAEGTAALMAEHERQVADYQETSRQRACQREARKMEAKMAVEKAAALREQERLQFEMQKNVKQQATSMMITGSKDPSCWRQDGNNMTAVEIPYLHVGGQARLQAGTYTLYWAIRVEKDSSLDDLTFEIYVPSNETEEMGDNTRIYKISPVLELSRSRGKGFADFEVGTFTIDVPSDTVQFKMWNHSTRKKRGLTIKHCEFRAS